MVEDYSTDSEVQDLISRFTFYIMPVVNPDGYVYTWETVSHVYMWKL